MIHAPNARSTKYVSPVRYATDSCDRGHWRMNARVIKSRPSSTLGEGLFDERPATPLRVGDVSLTRDSALKCFVLLGQIHLRECSLLDVASSIPKLVTDITDSRIQNHCGSGQDFVQRDERCSSPPRPI